MECRLNQSSLPLNFVTEHLKTMEWPFENISYRLIYCRFLISFEVEQGQYKFAFGYISIVHIMKFGELVSISTKKTSAKLFCPSIENGVAFFAHHIGLYFLRYNLEIYKNVEHAWS